MCDNPQPQPEGHVVQCGSCKGTGRVLAITCSVCKGVGSVLLK